MTCFEKLREIHPEWTDEKIRRFVEEECPDIENIARMPEWCDPFVNCDQCWNRDVPDTDHAPAADEPHIRDSGSRQEFSTGAVRDMGGKEKGRCDLLPLGVVAVLMNDGVIHSLAAFKDTGDALHLEGAVKIFMEARQWDISTMLLELSKHFAEGAEKYSEDNWMKGIPLKSYLNSSVRHYLKWLRGDKDEFHDRAFCWNVICACWTCIHKPELNDYAPRKNDFDPDSLMGEYEEEND